MVLCASSQRVCPKRATRAEYVKSFTLRVLWSVWKQAAGVVGSRKRRTNHHHNLDQTNTCPEQLPSPHLHYEPCMIV